MIILDKDSRVVISNAKISSFLESLDGGDVVLRGCEEVLEQYCETIKETLLKQKKMEWESEKIVKCLEKFGKETEKLMEKKSGDVREMLEKNVNEMRSDLCKMILSVSDMANKDVHIEKIKDVVKEVVVAGVGGEMGKMELKTSYMTDMLSKMHYEIRDYNKDNSEVMCNVKHFCDQMKDKLHDIEKYCLDTSMRSSVKKTVSEGKLFDLLSDRLMNRDGYVVEMVSGQANSCDILVKRETYPPIRIESKAHGRGSGEKVRTKEINKFKSDLMQLDNHGIFVSLYSNIVGKGELELEQLSNGKFAIYLSNNAYNMDLIVDMIQLLYKIDKITDMHNAEGGVILTTETMIRIQRIIKENNNKILSLKSHLRQSVQIVNDIELDIVTDIITGQCLRGERKETKENENESNKKETNEKEELMKFKCSSCGKMLKSNTALISHMKHCCINKD